MRARIRSVTWTAFLLVLGLDAYIATPISLGAFYFIPLAVSALRLSRAEAYGMALLSAAGRVFFGPAGDPLGIDALAVHLSRDVVLPLTAGVSLAGYFLGAKVLLTLGSQQRRILKLDRAAETDPLTGLGNRRYLLRRMNEARSVQASVSVLVLDVDHFKKLNDTHGHDGGDRVLQELARRLQGTVRQDDSVARIGGEEFVVLLAGKEPHAQTVADRILESIREQPFDVGTVKVRVTASAGLARGEPTEVLIRRADEALYEAKRGGRDRVAVAPEPLLSAPRAEA